MAMRLPQVSGKMHQAIDAEFELEDIEIVIQVGVRLRNERFDEQLWATYCSFPSFRLLAEVALRQKHSKHKVRFC